MTKRRNKTKKSKKKYKGRGYFTQYDYNHVFPTLIRNRIRRQRGGFLNRYDFAYAGKDTVNQAAKHLNSLAPQLVNQLMDRATTGLDKVTAKRVEQLSRETGQTLKKIAPGLIRGAIEELYKTPFRLLGNLGRKIYKELKKNVFSQLKIK